MNINSEWLRGAVESQIRDFVDSAKVDEAGGLSGELTVLTVVYHARMLAAAIERASTKPEEQRRILWTAVASLVESCKRIKREDAPQVVPTAASNLKSGKT